MNISNYSNSSNNKISLTALAVETVGMIGLVSNLFFLFILFKSKNLNDMSYRFIRNVAIADFLTCLQVCILFFPISKQNFFIKSKDNFQIYCKSQFAIIYVCYNVSVFSIVTISLYRHKIITDPFSVSGLHRFKLSPKLIIVIIWSISMALASPIIIIAKGHLRFRMCDIGYPLGTTFNIVFFTSIFFLTYLLPVIVICVSYTRVGFRLSRKVFPKNMAFITDRRQIQSQRLIKVLIGHAVIVMALSWPYLLGLVILSVMSTTILQAVRSDHLFFFANYLSAALLISLVVSIINPLFYFLFDKNVKLAIRKLLRVW